MLSLGYNVYMEKSNDMQFTFGEAVRFRRLQLGLTQQEVADHMKVSQNTLSRWETMGRPLREEWVLQRLADYLLMDIEDLRAGRVRNARRDEGVREQLTKIALEHAQSPEDIEMLVSLMEKALSLNPEGVRRVEEYSALLLSRFGREVEHANGTAESG